MECSLSVLREGWEAECYDSGRGKRRTITTQGGVGCGCNSKHYWLMELLLDRTNYFNRFFDRLFMRIPVRSACPSAKWFSRVSMTTFYRRKTSASNSSHHSSTWQVSWVFTQEVVGSGAGKLENKPRGVAWNI